ncbi:MAG: glutamate--tRNA ligase [Planctomycetota bacterium]
MSQPIRVRIAPSPTGTVHLGLCRTALFNWAYARRFGGKFILRIEDTDHDRNTAASERAILEGLTWLGLDWDEGPDRPGPYAPYRQSERVARHLELAQQLIASGHAYRDFSTAEELDSWRAEQEARKQRVAYRGGDRNLDAAESARRAAAGEPFAIRFRIPDGETTFDDLIRGTVTIPHHEIDDWVMVRRGGEAPTYNFVVVCDDVDMCISHVFRGEEHLVNTPKQILLYAALDYPVPAFAHLPLMLGTDRKKLSKRTGDTALSDYQEKGYPREAIVNFLALQGWALDGETDLFTRDDLLAHFDIRNVSKAGAVFDPDKFRWMAGEYLRREDAETLARHVAPHAQAAGLLSAEDLRARWPWFQEVVGAVRERLTLYGDFPAAAGFFFQPDAEVVYEEKAEAGARKRAGAADMLNAYADALEAGALDGETLRAPPNTGSASVGRKIPTCFQPLRLA